MTSGGAVPSVGDLMTRLKVAQRAVERLEEERERLEALVVRLGGIAGSLDANDVAEGVLEAVRDLTGASVGLFLPVDRGAFKEVCAPNAAAFQEVPDPARAPLLGSVLWRDQPVRIDDANRWLGTGAGDSSGFGTLADGRSLRSWLGAPVTARYGRVRGGLFLGHHRAHAFTARHESLASALAAHLGVALDNAALFEERSQAATALQHTLLPPLLPQPPGLDLAARYRPARSTSLVGGDFYDVFETGPGAWGLLLGDVSGAGPEAAAITGVARYAARALISPELSPAALLGQLNETLLRVAFQERFCTILYGEMRPVGENVAITLASGGHPPPVILRDDETVERLQMPGTLLGMFPAVAIEEREVLLRPGDALVSYTDGVTEARGPTAASSARTGCSHFWPPAPGAPRLPSPAVSSWACSSTSQEGAPTISLLSSCAVARYRWAPPSVPSPPAGLGPRAGLNGIELAVRPFCHLDGT